MGRPLTGRLHQRGDGRWVVEVPAARGDRRRFRADFATEFSATAWRDRALAALNDGRPLPPVVETVTAALLLQSPLGPAQTTAVAVAGTEPEDGDRAGETPAMTVEQVAADWVAERYYLARRGGAERAARVQSIVRTHVVPALTAYFDAGVPLTRAGYRDILVGLVSPHSDVPGKRGPKAESGLSEEYAKDVRTILDSVLAHGTATAGWQVPFDPAGVPTPRAGVSSVKAGKEWAPVSMADCARIAAHLHPVHQLVLWLVRIFGLHPGEAFGVRICDVEHLLVGSGRAWVQLSAQGGRLFRDYGEHVGSVETSTRRESMKTRFNVRRALAPRQLVELIDAVIEVFHVDPVTGHVDPEARLIPDLDGRGGGLSGFTYAFGRAVSKAGVVRRSAKRLDRGDYGPPTPKDLRDAMATDLARPDVPEYEAKRWIGHAPGTGVHDTVYVLDEAARPGLSRTCDVVEAIIDEQVPSGLIVPTGVSCTTGNQPALLPRKEHIDAQLDARGWTRVDGQEDDPLLGTGVAAQVLGVTGRTLARWCREGRIDGERDERGDWQLRTSVVEAYLQRQDQRVTLTDLEEQTGVSYHRLRGWALRFDLPLERDGHLCFVPEQTTARLHELADLEARLQEQGITCADAARELGCSVDAIDARIRMGKLTLLPERGPDGTRYLTRESVQELTSSQRRRRRRRQPNRRAEAS